MTKFANKYLQKNITHQQLDRNYYVYTKEGNSNLMKFIKHVIKTILKICDIPQVLINLK